jgi:hypothetical protein
MLEENGTQQINQHDSTSWWVILAAAMFLILSLGGLIYFFLTPVQ